MNSASSSNPHAVQNAHLARLARLGRRLGGEKLVIYLARWLYRLQTRGFERLPHQGAFLAIMNHQSMLSDALVYLLVQRCRPDVYIFGWQSFQGESPIYEFLSSSGEPDLERRFLRAYKARGISAAELLRARQVLLAGGTILLAAEGELCWDGHLQWPLAPGAAWLGLRTGVTIFPIGARGGYDVQPRWEMDRWRLTGRICLQVGRPFRLCDRPAEQVEAADLAAANQRLWQALSELCDPSASAELD